MNVHPSIWDRLNRLVLVLLVIAGLMGVFRWYLPLIQQNERMRLEILDLHRKIEAEAKTSYALRQAIDAQLRDPKTLVRQARETLSYAKPEETIFRFE